MKEVDKATVDAPEASEYKLLTLPNVAAGAEQQKAAKRPRIDSIGSNRSTKSVAAAKVGTPLVDN